MSFEIRKGTNVSHWLSQSEARGEERKTRFTREDVKRLRGLGCDHLRLPIDEEQMWNENNEKNPEAWGLLHEGIGWCLEEGMRAVVDLHILRGHYFNAAVKPLFDDPAVAERFGQCWRELSEELCGYSNDWVGYELMNEAVADDPEDWNRVLQIPYKIIREKEPERKIAIGSNKWCQVATFPDLSVPGDDENIILVFHFYDPMLITHYKAPWAENHKKYIGPIQYPGRPVAENIIPTLSQDVQNMVEDNNEYFDATVMNAKLQPAIKRSKELGLPLWCNEFGVYASVSDDIRRRWLRDFRFVLEQNGISWTNWDMRGDFGLFRREDNKSTVVAEALFDQKI